MEDLVNILGIIAILLVVIIVVLAGILLLIKRKEKKKIEEDEIKEKGDPNDKYKNPNNLLPKESIYDFMEFDEVKDNMIIRKNRTQYVMVIQCQGVNYDLMSEQEKIAVEEGFVQFLNTLRFPIQLYIQTRSLNLRDIDEKYKNKVKQIETEIEQLKIRADDARVKGNEELRKTMEYQARKKQNVLEYGLDITEYIGKLSSNRNVLQQKTYVVISYFASELGSTSTYSKDEIDNMCFSELYTRCQSAIRSLASSEVTGKVLNSEELTELLYVAYNRDDSEMLSLSKVLDSQYDALYSTGKDYIEKQQEQLDEQIDQEAIELATQSIIDANKNKNKISEEQKAKMVEERALDIVEHYKDQMEPELYKGTKEEVVKKSKAKKEKIAKEKKETNAK